MQRTGRLVLVLFGALAISAGAYATYKAFVEVITLRVAVESEDKADAVAIRALSEALTAGSRRTRIKIIATGSVAKSLEMVAQHQADITPVRADTTLPANLSSMMVLFQEVAVLGVPPNSKIEAWSDLKGRTLAVTGDTAEDDPLILALLKLNGASAVKRVVVPMNKLPAEFLKNSVQAATFVAPLTEAGIPGQRPPKSAWTLKNTPTILDTEDTESLAEMDKRYEEAKIPAGSLSANPARPTETISTLAVRRHLIIRDGTFTAYVRSAITDLLYAKRMVQGRHSELAQMGAPDLEASALVPVQSAAKAYFNDEAGGLIDKLGNWLYYGPLAIGALISLFAWLYKFVMKDESGASSEELAQEFMRIGIAGRCATSQEDRKKVRDEFQELLTQIEPNLASAITTPESPMPIIAAIEFASRSIESFEARAAI